VTDGVDMSKIFYEMNREVEVQERVEHGPCSTKGRISGNEPIAVPFCPEVYPAVKSQAVDLWRQKEA
jgi:hypothetical protein